MFRAVSIYLSPRRRFSGFINDRSLPARSSLTNEGESDESSMHRRAPYDRRRSTRSGGASSTQSRDDLSRLAEIERSQESERFIHELVTELAAAKEAKGQAMAELEERRQRIYGLMEELLTREQDVATLKLEQERVVSGHVKQHKKLHISTNNSIKQQKKSIATLSQTVHQLTTEKTELESHTKQQALHIAQLRHETETQRSNITELTGAILLSSTIATPSRDDDYFAGEFARLTGTIRQWVLRYFEPYGAPALTYRDLSESLAESLAKTVRAYSDTIAPDAEIKIGRKEIEAGISRMLTERIFNSSFVFTVSDWPRISPAEFPTVSDQETEKWRSQTASMLAQHSGFQVRFANTVTSVTKDLEICFAAHVKPGVEAARVKVLHTIVEHAARLELEISCELSKFQMPYICPGSRYEMEHVDDRSGVVDDSEDDSDSGDDEENEENPDEEEDDSDSGDEEENEENPDEEEKIEGQDTQPEKKGIQRRREFIVDTVLFPPVVRLEFDDKGKFATTPILIRKGVVTAIRS